MNEDALFLRPNGAAPTPGLVRRNHPMTAPAEDPRGGEAWRPVCGCEQGMGHMDRGCHSYGLCHAQSAERAARPAGDRAQPTQEVREAIVGWLFDFSMRRIQSDLRWSGDLGVLDEGGIELLREDTVRAAWRSEADAVLALPALAALLDAQAAVNRVKAVMTAWDRGQPIGGYLPREIRRALDGTT